MIECLHNQIKCRRVNMQSHTAPMRTMDWEIVCIAEFFLGFIIYRQS